MGHIVALSGGVGGAKLAFGLSKVLPPEDLTIIVNTGDDFEHFGLPISPDIDTLLYTLSELNDPGKGWGRADETWSFLETMKALGGEAWFMLGDRDLALHVFRKTLLNAGMTLTEVVAVLAERLGVPQTVLPMSNDPVRTMVDTDQGLLSFQHYFVRERTKPQVKSVSFSGAENASLSAELKQVFARSDLEGVIVCPSNPFLSIDPLLCVPGFQALLEGTRAPVIAVSPIVGGQAIKGPTAKMMEELGLELSAITVADKYKDFLDGFVLDRVDAALEEEVASLGLPVAIFQTVMKTAEDRIQLAQECLGFLGDIANPFRA